MKKVLITGGNKGIGLEITKLFLENGYQVFVLARDFKNFSLKAEKIVFDLTEIEKIPLLVKKIGDIDVLINNAGIMNSFPFDNYPEKKKREMLKINLEAPVGLISEFSRGMIKRGGGRIVSLASVAAEIGHPDVWYGITKAGVVNFTVSFAKLLGPRGIMVNCVAPSATEGTKLFSVIPEKRREHLKAGSLLGRFAKPIEIAQAVYWLGSTAPEYINGVCLDINNGAYFR
ncbi:MAG: SDR family oxidoreductase [Actinobacteria bacterium]|nr:SDR family oxidoreductase [Actinomycetota bacterium]